MKHIEEMVAGALPLKFIKDGGDSPKWEMDSELLRGIFAYFMKPELQKSIILKGASKNIKRKIILLND